MYVCKLLTKILRKLYKLKNNFIFSKNINNNKYKLIPFSINQNSVGKIKYFPADSKE
jgi:hypothetical protein